MAALFRALPLLACLVLVGCGSTTLVVRARYDALWDAARQAVKAEGYDLVDREYDGLDRIGGHMELTHAIRFLQGERLSLTLQADRPEQEQAREVHIGVREENTLVFILTLGIVGNRRLEYRERAIARGIREAMGRSRGASSR